MNIITRTEIEDLLQEYLDRYGNRELAADYALAAIATSNRGVSGEDLESAICDFLG